MTLTLTLTPERESRLQEQARQAGLPLEEYALRVLDGEAVTSPTPATPPAPGARIPNPTLALYAQWAEEDQTDDPAEIARRERVDEETASQLRQNRFNLEGRTDFRRLAEDQDDEAAA